MSFFRQLYRIARLEAMMDKLAGEGSGAVSVGLLKLSLWAQIKSAAMTEPEGQVVGLAKIASQIANTAEIGELSSSVVAKTASTEQKLDRDLLASSFASAIIVDMVVEKQAALGEISAEDASYMKQLNAESAVDDLVDIAKLAAPAWLTHPATIGAMGGSVLGAGLGAWGDQDDRTRGAIMGGIGGAAVGGLGGLAVHHWHAAAQAEAEAARAAERHEMAAFHGALEARKSPLAGEVHGNELLSAMQGDEALQAFRDANMKPPSVTDPASRLKAIRDAKALKSGEPVDVVEAIKDALHESTLKPEHASQPAGFGKTFHSPEMHGTTGGHQGPSTSSPDVSKKPPTK